MWVLRPVRGAFRNVREARRRGLHRFSVTLIDQRDAMTAVLSALGDVGGAAIGVAGVGKPSGFP